MNPVFTNQARMIAGVARVDVTPPVGMYHRMWGAAVHDRSTGIHRPLTATALWMQPRDGAGERTDSLLIVALDHCILERREMDALREAAGHAVGLPAAQVHICLSHTHGAGFMSRSRADLPGGDKIGPYLDGVVRQVAEASTAAAASAKPATLACGVGRCSLARHRDGYDDASQQYVCGFHDGGVADDTLVIGRLTEDRSDVGGPEPIMAVIVNYACHPTTLAWQNTLVSPDFVGALREVVEQACTGAPCVFLQGASGDLGPRDGFVGDTAVADRNGRQLAYAALATLAEIPPAGTKFVYRGPVVSGATLATWEHAPLEPAETRANELWRSTIGNVGLDYRDDLPTIDATRAELGRWKAVEEEARASGDEDRLRDARARGERMTRQLAKLSQLPAGEAFPYAFAAARTGGILWVIAPGELYQLFQTELRKRFPQFTPFIATIADDWQPGYLPTSATYGRGIYQEQIAVVAAGSLEKLIEQAIATLAGLVG